MRLLSYMKFAYISFMSIVCLFILSTGTFTKQKFLLLMRFTNFFFSGSFGFHFCLALDPQYFYIFFSKRFIDLYFTFNSTIHFELLFVSGLRLKWRFLFLPVAPSSFVEKTILLHCISLHHCLKSVGHTCVGQFVGSLFWSTDTFVYPFPVTIQP